MAKFQPPPSHAQKFLEGEQPSHAWQRWFELVAQALTDLQAQIDADKKDEAS